MAQGGHAKMFCLAKKHLGPSHQSLGLKSPWHGVCLLQTPHLEARIHY